MKYEATMITRTTPKTTNIAISMKFSKKYNYTNYSIYNPHNPSKSLEKIISFYINDLARVPPNPLKCNKRNRFTSFGFYARMIYKLKLRKSIMYTFDSKIVSDLHKEAYGCRPNQFFFDLWSSMTDDKKQATWDSLELKREIREDERKNEEAAAVAVFERLISETIALGATNRADALRWLVTSNVDVQDPEHALWKHGVLFAESGKYANEVKEAFNV